MPSATPLRFVPPCVPVAAATPPAGDAWLHEPKWDGYRTQVIKQGRTVRIFSRGGHDWSERLPTLVSAYRALPARQAILDGELCLPDARGVPDFYRLSAATHPPHDARLVFYCFDVMHLNGTDLRSRPLVERKRRLARLSEKSKVPNVFFVEHFADAAGLFQWCERLGLEGIVSKRANSLYHSGKQRDWRKVKCATWRKANRNRWKLFEGRR